MPNLPKKFPRDICAYCGSSENLSSDHVPPKNLFPKPRPSNTISVPACPECHSGTSKDDEYFRLKICLRHDAGEHPSARAQWDPIIRSLRKKDATGFRRQTLSDLRQVQLYTATGLYVSSRLAMDVEKSRIRRVVERTVRGLYFAEFCHPLGLSNGVLVLLEEDLDVQPRDFLDELKRTTLAAMATIAPKVIGDDVFQYRYLTTGENPLHSVWLISFYGQVDFLCVTGPGDPPSLQADI